MMNPERGDGNSDHQDQVTQRLTDSILTLKQTIRNVRDDFSNGIAPSMIFPSDESSELEQGMLMLTLEPSAEAIDEHLSPIEDRLRRCERILVHRGHWRQPEHPPKSPEYSIIDVSDLSSATKIIEDIINYTCPAKTLTPYAFFSQYEWNWDPIWKEFYARIPGQTTLLYLSRWRLNAQSQIWEHESTSHLDLVPETAAYMLGSWEDWTWNSVWREWYLDVSKETAQNEVCRVYASPWQLEDGEWLYTGALGHV